MIALNCEDFAEDITECARRGATPAASMRAHLNRCAVCAARLESESALTREMAVLRSASRTLRSPDQTRIHLMQQFDATRRQRVPHRLVWALAAAAVFVMGVLAVRELPRQLHVNPASAASTNMEDTAPVALADPAEEGFIDVPYIPPLAPGESVHVVHTELYPAALASLGFNVDPAWTAAVSADLLMGEDGFPRAVRIADFTERTI